MRSRKSLTFDFKLSENLCLNHLSVPLQKHSVYFIYKGKPLTLKSKVNGF